MKVAAQGSAAVLASRRPAKITPARLAIFAEALVLITLATVAIKWSNFGRLGRIASAPFGAPRKDPEAVPDLVRMVAWAALTASRRVPWRTVCFHEGLAAQVMLRRRGIPGVLHFGAMHDPEVGVRAHVWVTAGDFSVVGVDNAAGFAPLAAFPDLGGGADPRRRNA